MSTKLKGQLLAWVEKAVSRPDILADPEFAQLIGDSLHMLHEEDTPLLLEIEDHPNVIPLSRRRG